MSNTARLNTCPKCGATIPGGAPQGLCPKCVMAGAGMSPEAGLPPTATAEIPSLERVATAFPQLEVLELIGRGGMGFVFKARQPSLDRLVALKLLPDKLARDPNFTERFNREGRVLGRLNHPNIVSIYDFGQTGGFYFLLMKYVDGVNLRQAMQAGRFSPGEALAIVPKVCEALQYAHEQGVLHRDIKPENILLDAKGRVKIADFGIAKLVDDSPLEVTLTGTGAALGTPHYMAPEQLEKPSTVDHRADIYSLGVVFYEMLTGELPIGRFAAPSAKTPVNANVDDVVFRTLEKDRERRYQSADEMKTQVEHLGEGANSAPIQRGSGEVAKNEKRRVSEWSIYGALIFISLLVTGIGVVLVTKPLRQVHYKVDPPAERVALAQEPVAEAAPMIQFTFTSVELREEAGTRWLAMDYAEQTRGDCERIFRYEAKVPGFTAQTRMEAFMTDAKAGFAPVRHQRALWKLPDSLAQADVLELRDRVTKEWGGKSVTIEPGDERMLFNVAVPDGGTLTTFIGVTLRKTTTGAPQEAAMGSAKLIGAGQHRNFAIARIESVPGHPLHELVARFAGPEISAQTTATLSALSGPKLVPSADEDMNIAAEPVDGSKLWGTNREPIVASAISFECPGDYSLQFVLPDAKLAQEAARQMNETLAHPLALVPGRPVPLFIAGQWRGWLETRPFQAEPNRFTFSKHPGLSPAQVPGTNRIESAVATIPPGHELKLVGRVVVNGVYQPEPVFSTTLTSGLNQPGVYWFTWYLLPNPQRMELEPKANWELQIHDAVGREWLRSQAPEGMNLLWRKKWVGDEPISARAGKQIKEVFFEKVFMAGDRGPTMVLLEMTMQRSAPADPDQ